MAIAPLPIFSAFMTQATIRGMEIADWQDIAEILLSPKCQQDTLRLPYQSRDRFQQGTEKTIREDHGLVAVVEGKAIGTISLHPLKERRSHVGEIGMAVRDDYQGKGIGSQLLEAIVDLAENWLNLQRLELEVYCHNQPAIALYQKYNFAIEGTLRKYAFCNGVYVDAYAMARIRDSP
ncbi:MAG: GNAT family N-acetyltransferase [Spirulina sp.]